MKKLFIGIVAVILCVGLSVPASAFENEFGGYWRTRAYTENNWDAEDSGSSSAVDTRTRLYYTAKFSEDFKFVNKFEFNNTWGDNNGGDINADGTGIFRIKNSYVNFNTGPMNFKIGIQGDTVARGFVFSDDFSGLIATFKAGDNSFSATWMKVDEKNVKTPSTALLKIDSTTNGNIDFNNDGVIDENDVIAVIDFDGDGNIDADDVIAVDIDGDGEISAEEADKTQYLNWDLEDKTQNERDYYMLSAALNLSDTLSMSPFLLIDKQESTDTTVYFVGTDLDAKMGETSLWSSLVYETGETGGVDNAAYLLALGVDAGIAHGQFFYASGDDDATDDKDNKFIGPAGKSYYWSEILGFGIFDQKAGFATAPNDAVSNVMAANIGTTFKPMDKLSLSADLWYAQLAEEVAGEDELGVEVDVKATYKVLENLNLDLVAAYLVAGDAAGDENVTEMGTRLSFSF